MTSSRGNKLIQSLVRTTQRAASTSQSNSKTITLDEMTEQACPFRKSLDKIGSIFDRKHQTEADNLVPETKVKPFKDVPGPKGYPIVGTLFDYFKKDGLRFDKMFEAYQKRAIEYGPIYKESIAAISTVVISDPIEYNKVIQAERKYPNRREMEPMAHYRRKKNIGLGLVNAQGEEWHKHRSVVSKKMLKLKEVLTYCDEMNTVADDFIKHLQTKRRPDLEIHGIEEELFKWAMESIGTFLFEERIGCLGEKTPQTAKDFIENLQGFFKLMQPLMYNLPLYKVYPTKLWRQYEQYTDNILKIGRSFVDKKVKQLETTELNNGDHVPFLIYLLSQQSLTPNEALSTAVDLLVGATETTTTGSLWALYCLAKNQDVQEKLYRETNSVLPNDEPITVETLAKLPYIKAVIKETFRLYPITFATSRHIEDDLEVGGYMLPAGTHVQANLYGMFHDASLYPEPKKFKPERWLDGDMDRKLKSLSNLVWGHGARMCIGRRFAEQEMNIMISKIIQNFRIEYHHDDLEPVLNTVMTPDRPLKLKFIPRHRQ